MSMNRRRGFSLIELVIVMLIIAVLAAIAVPTYQSYITRATRTKATEGLTNLAGLEERFFYSNNTYTKNLSDLGQGSSSGFCVASCTDARYYEVTIFSASSTDYLLQAAPEDVQAIQDTQCGTLTLNRAGVKTASKDPSNQNRCWGS